MGFIVYLLVLFGSPAGASEPEQLKCHIEYYSKQNSKQAMYAEVVIKDVRKTESRKIQLVDMKWPLYISTAPVTLRGFTESHFEIAMRYGSMETSVKLPRKVGEYVIELTSDQTDLASIFSNCELQ